MGRETIKACTFANSDMVLYTKSRISVGYLCLPLSTHELLLFELFILLAVHHERSVAAGGHALVEPICFS